MEQHAQNQQPFDDSASGLVHIFHPTPGSSISDFKLLGQLNVVSAQADIWMVEKHNQKAILKLYRHGFIPGILDESKLTHLEHPQIIKTFALGQQQGRYFEIIEYFPLGSLDTLLKNGKLSDSECHMLLAELTAGLIYLHKNSIIHRDIKPANIMIRNLEPLSVVLADFGESKSGSMTTQLTGTVGTLLYSAPELSTGLGSKSSDWWSLGMVMLEALSGVHPFKDLDTHHLSFKIQSGNVPLPAVSAAWTELLQGLLTPHYRDRWTGNQIAQWISNPSQPVQPPLSISSTLFSWGRAIKPLILSPSGIAVIVALLFMPVVIPPILKAFTPPVALTDQKPVPDLVKTQPIPQPIVQEASTQDASDNQTDAIKKILQGASYFAFGLGILMLILTFYRIMQGDIDKIGATFFGALMLMLFPLLLSFLSTINK